MSCKFLSITLISIRFKGQFKMCDNIIRIRFFLNNFVSLSLSLSHNLPVVEPLVDCGFEPPISDVNTSITHSTKKFLSIVIVNSELTGKMNFKSHFCQKLIFKSAKVHNITKFPDFFLLNFRVCEPVHGSM